MPRAGASEILDIPPEHDQYLQGIQSAPWFSSIVRQSPWAFKFVEIGPLLSFQINLSLDRSNALCSRLNDNPTVEDLLSIAMPDKLEDLPTQVSVQSNSIVITSLSRNLRLQDAVKVSIPGSEGRDLFGIQVGPAAPITQIARVDGRCYLRNGFHRAVGMAQRGVTHIPALLIDMENYEEVTRGGLMVFDKAVLESENPPTVDHFTHKRAFPVTLRDSTMVITLNWSQHVIYDAT